MSLHYRIKRPTKPRTLCSPQHGLIARQTFSNKGDGWTPYTEGYVLGEEISACWEVVDEAR